MKSKKINFSNCVKNFFIFTLIIFLFSCEKDGGHEAVSVDTDIWLIVKDSIGNDLLNPSNPNAINIDNIKIIHEVNGEQVVYYDELMDYPKGIKVLERDGLYYLSFFVNTDVNSKQPVTYVQWNDSDIDKFSCEILRTESEYGNSSDWVGGSSTYINKVWLNDKLVWTTSQGERVIELIK